MALERKPGYARAAQLRARALQLLGRGAEAEQQFQSANAAQPADLLTWLQRATDVEAGSDLDASVAHWDAMQAQFAPGHPQHARVRFEYANFLQRCGRFPEAEAGFKAALALTPDEPDYWFSLGILYQRDLVQIGAAIAAYRRALALRPQFDRAHCNLGLAMVASARFDEAIASFDAALAINPANALAHNGYANALKKKGDVAGALAHFRQARALDPADPDLIGNFLMTALYYEQMDYATIVAEHLAGGAAIAALAGPPVARQASTPGARLRLGFVSSDLGDHPVTYFVEPLFDRLRAEAVDCFVYANQRRSGPITQRLRQMVHRWREVDMLSDTALAELIARDQVDVLVDLSGYTAGNRMRMLAMRPAPVQVSWLGYQCTTGHPAIDWRISDAVGDPPGVEAHYSEQLLRLEGGFCVYRPLIRRPDAVTSAAYQVGPAPLLSQGGITFGSCNSYTKLTDATLRAWSRILAGAPGARLLIEAESLLEPAARATALARLAAHDIAPERVTLLQRDSAQQYLTYHRIDIVLDTFPFNGGTSTCDALWMGVPVVTLRSVGFAGRMGASLLNALGRPEWVADNVDQYVAIALALAADANALVALRAGLRAAMQASALMDETGFARRFLAAARQMALATPAAAIAGPVQPARLAQEQARLVAQLERRLASGAADADEMLDLLRQLLSWEPQRADLWHQRGHLHKTLGKMAEAARDFAEAAARDPSQAQPLVSLANLYFNQKNMDLADRAIGAALQRAPRLAGALHTLAAIRQQQGRLADAAVAMRTLVEVDPVSEAGWRGLSLMLALQDQDQALAELADACPPWPQLLGSITERGLTRRLAQAARRACARWCTLAPDDAYAWQLSSRVALECDQDATAAAVAIDRSLAIAPNEADAWFQRAQVLASQGASEALAAAYQEVLKRNPEHVNAWNNLGAHYLRHGPINLALGALQRAAQLDPERLSTLQNFLLALNVSAQHTPAQIAKAHTSVAGLAAVRQAARVQHGPRAPGPLRFGLLSPDLYAHPVSCFVEPLLAQLPRHGVQVHLFSTRKSGDAVSARLAAYPGVHWHDVAALDDDALVARIGLCGIDVLADLSGHGPGNRMMVFARKAAPVQVSWLGYMASTGLPEIDHRISDGRADPPGAEALYSEHLWRLAASYCCYRPMIRFPERRADAAYAVSPLPAAASGVLTLGSCNHLAKVSDQTLALWGTLLARLPQARLLLESVGLESEAGRARAKARCVAHGIPAERLVLLARDTSQQYLRYHQIDIALDPFPYNGGTTTCDALWMGVPVVSLAGASFAGRMGVALLGAAGHPEWVATDAQGYVACVQALAGDLGALARVRAGLRAELEASDLMDEAGFGAAMAAALTAMLARHVEGVSAKSA